MMPNGQDAQPLESLPAFVRDATFINVVVAAGNDLAFQLLQLHDDLVSEFRSVALDWVTNVGEECTVLPYEAGYKPDSHEVMRLPIDANPAIMDAVNEVTSYNNLAPFSESPDVIDGLRFYALTATSGDDEHAVFFRTFSPTKELSRTKKFGVMLAQGAYDKIRENVFLFDRQLDCVVWNGWVYVLNVTPFERIFQHLSSLRDRASNVIDRINNIFPIANLEEFRAACMAHTMARKLAAIDQRAYLDQVTREDVERTIQEFELDIQIVSKNGTQQLLFEPQRSKRWMILKLLDDDYLGSSMTDGRYAVNSKLTVR